jgi:hypothetical protein
MQIYECPPCGVLQQAAGPPRWLLSTQAASLFPPPLIVPNSSNLLLHPPFPSPVTYPHLDPPRADHATCGSSFSLDENKTSNNTFLNSNSNGGDILLSDEKGELLAPTEADASVASMVNQQQNHLLSCCCVASPSSDTRRSTSSASVTATTPAVVKQLFVHSPYSDPMLMNNTSPHITHCQSLPLLCSQICTQHSGLTQYSGMGVAFGFPFAGDNLNTTWRIIQQIEYPLRAVRFIPTNGTDGTSHRRFMLIFIWSYLKIGFGMERLRCNMCPRASLRPESIFVTAANQFYFNPIDSYLLMGFRQCRLHLHRRRRRKNDKTEVFRRKLHHLVCEYGRSCFLFATESFRFNMFQHPTDFLIVRLFH